jgi:purine-cytosine permease-like protein
MMTSFPLVLFGYEWYRSGFSLAQVLTGAVTACIIIVVFQLFSGFMGAKSGLNYVLLLRKVFGSSGSKIVSLVWCLLFLAWYSLNAVLLTEAIKGLFGLSLESCWLAVPLAILMAVNNWFGFRGVANFARYLAAPVLILWVAYALFKVLIATPVCLTSHSCHQSFSYSLVVIPVLIVGSSMWGNEPDFFRFGKPSKFKTVLPLVVSVLIGQILFPVTGWLLGRISNAADIGAFTKFMNAYSFGHNPWLAAFVLAVSYFALNDGNLYGAINGLEDFWKTRRHRLVLALVVAGAALAVVLSRYSNALDVVATFGAVLLPCATIVVIFEYYLAHKVSTGMRPAEFLQLLSTKLEPEKTRATAFCWAAVLALFVGWAVAVATSGTIPQLKSLNNGVWILYAWGSSFVVYGIFRTLLSRKRTRKSAEDTTSTFIDTLPSIPESFPH